MLYGDGLHDDTAAIQSLLDSGNRLVELPVPSSMYLISGPLKVHSNQELKMSPLTHIRLMDNSNCIMLQNADYENGNENIYITGGIWDVNNKGQLLNPIHFPHPELPDYNGYGFLFQNVKYLHLTNLTLKDPVTYAATLDTVSYFTVENITFDFNYGNPWPITMDGIHMNGNCHFGSLRNLKGACYDDLVALTADEGSHGPISHIDVDGIYADNCHSAVRFLSVECPVEDVHIHNVYGTFYQYCIGITKYYPERTTTAYYDAIVIDNIFASKAERFDFYRMNGTYVYPLLWIEEDLVVRNLTISNVFRKEKTTPISTLYIGKGTIVENLNLHTFVSENHVNHPMPLIDNEGIIEKLYADNLRTDGDEIYTGNGVYPEKIL